MSDEQEASRTDASATAIAARYSAEIPRVGYTITVSVSMPPTASPALHENAREIVQHIANMAKRAFVGTVRE